METDAILDGVVTHLLSSGRFESVNRHEPKNAPGNGLTAAVWLQHVVPLPAQSGLYKTAGRALFQVRLYSNMLAEPFDEIDPELYRAVDDVFGRYSSDFTLDGLINSIDLLGRHGIPLSAKSGYVNVGQGWYRIVDIDVPLIIDDIWTQVA